MGANVKITAFVNAFFNLPYAVAGHKNKEGTVTVETGGLSGYNLVKYIWKFGEIHFAIGTNTFCNSDKYILQFRQILFAI